MASRHGRVEDVCSSSPVRTPKLQVAVNNHYQQNVGLEQKTYPSSKSKGKATTRQQEGQILI